MARCAICRQDAAERGVLCATCASAISEVRELCPEQVVSPPSDARAWLIDPWGRPHAVPERCRVGRSGDVEIITPVVSRSHAVLLSQDDEWWVHDMGSTNGTRINGRPVQGAARLGSGDRIGFGHLAFYFAVGDLPALPPGDAAYSTTDGVEDDTVNLEIELMEPAHGGGGVLAVAGRRVDLTLLQYELLDTLLSRLEADRGRPEDVLGWVTTPELVAMLSWSTRYPGEANVKQLVRRLRRKLDDTWLAIESHRGFGYRLRVEPEHATS